MILKGEMGSFFSGWSAANLRDRIRRLGSPSEEPPKMRMRVLETERLLLREFGRDDGQHLTSWRMDSGAAYTADDAQEFLDFCFREYARWGIGPWGLVLKQTGILVGNSGFCRISSNRKTGEVNYFVTTHYRGQGLASEALGAIMEFGLGEIGFTRIEGRCPPENVSSERVLRKTGMKFERMIRENLDDGVSKNRFAEFKLYAIPRRDFKPSQAYVPTISRTARKP